MRLRFVLRDEMRLRFAETAAEFFVFHCEVKMPIFVPPPQLANCLPTRFPGAARGVTCNYGLPLSQTCGRGGHAIIGVVLHCVRDTLSTFDAKTATPLKITAPSKPDHASLHYLISKSGALIQYLDDECPAWAFTRHIGESPLDLSGFNWAPIAANPGVQPDLYTIHVGIEASSWATDRFNACIDCQGKPAPTSDAGLEMLSRLLKYLSEKYNLPFDTDHFQFHQNIESWAEGECGDCADIANVMGLAASWCEQCANPEEPLEEIVGADIGFVNVISKFGCKAKATLQNVLCAALATLTGNAKIPYGGTGVVMKDCRTAKLPDAPVVDSPDQSVIVDTSSSTPTSPIFHLQVQLCALLARLTGTPIKLSYGSSVVLVGKDCQLYTLPDAPQIEINGQPVTPGGTPTAPVYNIVVSLCNLLSAISGTPAKIGYGSGTQFIGKDCQPYTMPDAPAFTSDGTVQVTPGGTSVSPVYNLVVNICNALAKITGTPIKIGYGSAVELVGKDCKTYQMPDAPAFTSDGTVQITPGGTPTSPVYNLIVNTCSVLSKITGAPVKLAYGGSVRLAGLDCSPYSMPDAPAFNSPDESVVITPGGTAASPTFSMVVNLCKALLGVVDLGNTAAWGSKILVKKPDGTCELMMLPTPAVIPAQTPISIGALDGISASTSGVDNHTLNLAANVNTDCTLAGKGTAAQPLSVSPGVLLIGSSLNLNAANVRPWQVIDINDPVWGGNPPPHANGDPISDTASVSISNPSMCKTARVKVDAYFGYWGYQTPTVQDESLAAGFEINVGSGWKRASVSEGDEGKDIQSTPPSANASDVGQDGTSVSFVINIAPGATINVQARVVKLGGTPITGVYYAEIPVISWIGMAF